MDALKPCPFCGGEAALMGGSLSQEEPTVWCINGHHFNGGAEVWNTRADLDRWHRMDEMPEHMKDGRRVILVPWDDFDEAFVSFWMGDRWANCEWDQLTHWMHLTTPPKATP